MDRAMKSRTFEVVVFYDECAWVASTIGNTWFVGQGKDAHAAVENLRFTLTATALLHESEGYVPFSGPLEAPKDIEQRYKAATPLARAGNPQVGRSYRLNLTVKWGEAQARRTFKR